MGTDSSPSRRLFLGGLAASLLLPRVARASGPAPRRPLVVVILRGGLDGLAAVPPVGDPDYARVRGALALPGAGAEGGVLPIGQTFALHPALRFLHERWAQKELVVQHAAATPYRNRSHFDAQDVLESGVDRVFAADSGWLSRALERRGTSGVAVGSTTPLVLRGPGASTSWSPSKAPPPDDDTLDRLADLYAGHPVLAEELAMARRTADLMGDAARRAGQEPDELVRAGASLLLAPDGPEAAVLSLSGWDTHANQGASDGALARRLRELDDGLRALHGALGEAWSRTMVLVLTEFGRTATPNGTKGTDHGTGAAAFLLGGAVKGGRVLGDWPGLRDLHEGRDLRPANDVRRLVAGALAGHWGVEGALEGVAPLDGLARS
jgi:uncharacterized protein (DUF1501 family)